MPGFHGCLPRTAHGHALADDFARVWSGATPVESANGVAGAHTHGVHPAVHVLRDGSQLLVDGDVRFLGWARAAAQDPAIVWNAAPPPELPCAGSWVWLSADGRSCRLGTDGTGTFPIYYAERDGALLFCTLLGPLARALSAPADPVGVAEYILHDYTLADRTMRKGVRRLLAGQVLSFAEGGRATIEETSRLWVGLESAPTEQLVDQAWSQLCAGIDATLGAAPRLALMMSAGWDSRLILAALLASGKREWTAFTHGDARARELRTIDAMCRASAVPWRCETLGPLPFEAAFLRGVMARTECILFPPWSRAGSLLAADGTTAIAAGTYGEVLGGHYSPAGLVQGGRRGLEVLRSWLPASTDSADASEGAERIRAQFQLRHQRKPRFVQRAFLEQDGPVALAMDADLARDVERLRARGITRQEQLVEAFISEHRGTQYINGQALAARAWLDVSLPFADRALLELASRVPLAAKVQNAFHRRILARRAPELLRHPTAAVWVPASSPILVQEVSRVGRWLVEKARWRMSAASRGRIAPDTSGWWNFEFLRGGDAFRAMSADLTGELWDRGEVERWIRDVADYTDRRPVYPDILLKAYAVDLALR